MFMNGPFGDGRIDLMHLGIILLEVLFVAIKRS
jgi:hypothetical protein